MNSISGHIGAIRTSGNISMVSVGMGNDMEWHSVVLDTPETVPYLVKGNKINMLFKETEVVVCVQKEIDISIDNRVLGVISMLEKGVLFSRLVLETGVGEIVALTSTDSLYRLNLKNGMVVMAMVKSNGIILAP